MVRIDENTALNVEELDWVLTAISLTLIETTKANMLDGAVILNHARNKLQIAWSEQRTELD